MFAYLDIIVHQNGICSEKKEFAPKRIELSIMSVNVG